MVKGSFSPSFPASVPVMPGADLMRGNFDKRLAVLEGCVGDSASEDALRAQREWHKARFPYLRDKLDELIRRGADDETREAEMAALRRELDTMFPRRRGVCRIPSFRDRGSRGSSGYLREWSRGQSTPNIAKFGRLRRPQRRPSGRGLATRNGGLWGARRQWWNSQGKRPSPNLQHRERQQPGAAGILGLR
jgi:hypothetical protein